MLAYLLLLMWRLGWMLTVTIFPLLAYNYVGLMNRLFLAIVGIALLVLCTWQHAAALRGVMQADLFGACQHQQRYGQWKRFTLWQARRRYYGWWLAWIGAVAAGTLTTMPQTSMPARVLLGMAWISALAVITLHLSHASCDLFRSRLVSPPAAARRAARYEA